MSLSYNCPLCNFISPTRSLWLSHLRGVHCDDDDFRIVCGISDCTSCYSKCSSFVSHVYRKHRDALSVPDEDSQPTVDTTLDQDATSNELDGLMLMDRFESNSINVDMQHTISQIMGTDGLMQRKKSALYILNLKEIHGLSEVAVRNVIQQTQSIFFHTVHRIKAGVSEHLSRSGIEAPSSLHEMFTNVVDPFQGLHTVHLQEKFYRESLDCIDPEEVRIGPPRYVTKFSGSKRAKALRWDTIQYIPVEDSLANLLQSAPDVVSEIENFHGSGGNVMRDMCDGTVYKDHPIFQVDKQAIQLIAYYDEIELCNPLGSSVKKHKLGCLFFTIGNLHPRYRSQLKCIFVAAIGSNVVIKRHGINLFLQRFVESVKKLSEEGLSVCLNGTTRVFRVGLLAVLADTLAAHAIGGMKESMSFAKRICRSCMATTELIQEKFEETDFELRSPDKHKTQLEQIREDPAKSVQYGINFESILDKVPHFSVVQNIPHDIMHDLLEGVVPYEMKLLLTYLADSKLVFVTTINDRLKRFDFGYTEISDIPSPIDDKIVKTDKKIRQSASKMLLLATYLPLLIGDLIPEDCERYSLFLILLRICTITMSWEVSADTISYLRILIEEHHVKFKRLYPSATFIPKMHYMVHYPTQIIKYGPLIYSWTMRHEAKLQTIKRAAKHGNFKNISYTIAKKTQHTMCYFLKCGTTFLEKPTEFPNTSVEVHVSANQNLQAFLNETGILNVTIVRRITWLKHGIFHLKKYAFLYLCNADLYPEFGKIQDILLLEYRTSPCYIILIEKCETLYFDSHFNGYVIKPLNITVFVNLLNVPCHPTLHSHKAFGKTEIFITLKHYIT